MLRFARAFGVGCGLWLWALAPGLRAQEQGKERQAGEGANEAAASGAKPSSPPAKPQGELQPPAVKLLQAGAEPRLPLRIKVAKGLVEDLVMTMKMDMSLEMNGNPLPPTPVPGQQMTMQTRVLGVAANGDIDQEFVFTRIDVPDQDGIPETQIEMMRSMLKPMVGLKGTATVSERGVTRKLELEKKEGMSPLVERMLDGMSGSFQTFSFPLPEEPVGAGARWEVKHELEMQGIRLKQTAVYELGPMTGSVRQLRVTIEQTADEQTVSPPGLPPGARVQLRSMASQGKGEILLDVARVLPRSARIDTESDANMTLRIGAQEQKLRQKMKIAMELKGQEGKEAKE